MSTAVNAAGAQRPAAQSAKLQQLQCNLRNTLATFGPKSPQYHAVRAIVEEHERSAAARVAAPQAQSAQTQSDTKPAGQAPIHNLAFRPKVHGAG
ncbi:MAG: hypothetical protein INR71_08255 [Terriglobus roseus]|nr:hypothetical protein [Terriglobus roseus]